MGIYDVELRIHYAPIYRQMWTRMATAPNRPVKHNAPKSPHETACHPSMLEDRAQRAERLPHRTGFRCRTTHQRETASNGGKPMRPRPGDMTGR